ncbi:GlxA family transcriptional regulator [Gordonia sp. NPDC003429]
MGARHRIAVLAQEQAYPFELGIPTRIFTAADAGYEVRVCTATGQPITSNAGFSVMPDHGPEIIDDADTVIVPPVDAYHLQRNLRPEVAEVVASIREGTRIVSICTGGFTLAAAGLLDGRRATTHWECAPLFHSWYPTVDLHKDVLFVHDGGVHTSAGAAAGIDLCLDLIRSDHGARAAGKAARRCIVAPFRDGGQAQFIERPLVDTADASTAGTREWALNNLDTKITIADLARYAHMSERTLVRKFTAETGIAPRRWLTLQRLARARELLEESEMSIEDVAAAVGYATATSLRNHLSTNVGLLPAAYRRSFHRPAENSAAMA